MEIPSLVSPKNPHFFQPLLAGFKSHIKIPVSFFSKHIEGKHEGKTVYLRSDSSEKTWKVKMEGYSLTDGWKEFVEAHDLRIHDFVIFRHKGDLLFHVCALGPSFCELQYAPSLSHVKEEESDEIGESSRKEKETEEEDVKTESDQFSSDLTCFSLSVTSSSLSRDSVSVPIHFAKQNGLNKERRIIVLMNEEEKSWKSHVKIWMSGQVFIVGGWKSFCTENNLEDGDSCTFKLLHNGENPVFRLCGHTKAGTNRFVKITLTYSSLEYGKQYLPVSFTRANKLSKPGTIILVDKDKVEWYMKLSVGQRSYGEMYIISHYGWKRFCAANEVGEGETLSLELIRGGTCPLLKFVPTMEHSPFEAEARTHKRARIQRCSKESRSKHDVRQKITEEGGPSRRTRSSSSNSTGDPSKLQHTQFRSISDHVAKVKQSVEDTLTCITRFEAELETKKHNLEALLQEIENLGMI